MFQKFFSWFKGFFRKEKPFKYIFIEDVPDDFKKKIVYVVGESGFSWQLVMLCPCGCGAVLYMNLIEEEFPCWSFTFNKKKQISIHPSINRFVGCKSHFFLKEGRVIWA
ncbi:hypothetical protein BCY89_13915 [Sphingobacterium siyangense]|uniref:Uncharacterized protein n=1 Tax=Sphingobacterium siyangense TaxID=459529 RepID=A0A420FH39_9SPHI|nr:hypothetical protein BCY89_13915 [Sphingobacterium siyangense]